MFLFSILAFPTNVDEFNSIINLKYENIKRIITERIESFFKTFDEINNNLNLQNDNLKSSLTSYNNSATNQILTKILLENNRWSGNKLNKPTSILINKNDKLITGNKTRVLICSDLKVEDKFNYDQKLIFLLKRQNIHIDSISIGVPGEVIVKYFLFNF